MPITGRTPEDCFEKFREHVARVVAATLSSSRFAVLGYVGGGRKRTLAFLRGDPTTLPIETLLGRLHLYLAQELEAVKDGKRFRLKTSKYWYRIQEDPDWNEKALIRWEYDRKRRPDQPKFCRNHVQIASMLGVRGDEMNLDIAHLPTGWVTFEEVIRFLIVDLEVRPPQATTWDDTLRESEEAFYEEFSPKGHTQQR